MQQFPDCLESLLGLAAEPLPCFPFPADTVQQARITASGSGLYLPDAEGLPTRPARSSTSGPTDLYARFAQARRTGVLTLRSVLTQALAGHHTPVTLWSGELGSASYTSTAPAGQPARLELHTQDRPGQVLRIDALTVLTDQPAENLVFTLDGKPVPGVFASNQGGQTLATPLLVPLDGQSHMLEVQLPAGVRPRVSKLCCAGCGGCAVLGSFLRNEQWTSQGVSLRGGLSCDAEARDVVCYAASTDAQGKPRNPELHLMLAQALLFASARAYVLALLTDTAEGSRYTALGPDQLTAVAEVYETKLKEHTDWLGTRAALIGLSTPCLKCTPGAGPTLRKSYGY